MNTLISKLMLLCSPLVLAFPMMFSLFRGENQPLQTQTNRVQLSKVKEFVYDVADDVALSSDKSTLIVSTRKGIQLFDVETLDSLGYLFEKDFSSRVYLAASPYQPLLAVSGTDFNGLEIWSLSERRLVRRLDLPSRTNASAISWSPDGSQVSMGGYIWSLATGHLVHEFNQADNPIRLSTWLPNGEHFLTISEALLQLWSSHDFSAVDEVVLPLLTRKIAISPDTEKIALLGEGSIFIYRLDGMVAGWGFCGGRHD